MSDLGAWAPGFPPSSVWPVGGTYGYSLMWGYFWGKSVTGNTIYLQWPLVVLWTVYSARQVWRMFARNEVR